MIGARTLVVWQQWRDAEEGVWEKEGVGEESRGGEKILTQRILEVFTGWRQRD